MEQKEIIEGNRLIAEFDGYIFKKNDTLNGIKGVFRKEGILPMLEFEHKYHSSWNLLMPVVEKIETLGFIVIIERNSCYVQSHDTRSVYSTAQFFKNKIETVFVALINFIKWYNQPRP